MRQLIKRKVKKKLTKLLVSFFMPKLLTIMIKIDSKKVTVSDVTMEYSKNCEIKDINVLSSPIDDIIYKLYEDFEI